MRNTPCNTDDVIDSRDIIARIEELESDRQDLVDAVTSAEEDLADASDDTSVLADDQEELSKLGKQVDESKAAMEEWDADNGEELMALKSLQNECEGYSDWTYGESLIRDSYFEEYAQQVAEDIGAINKDASWPNCHIDWKSAADDLKQNYTSVSFDGEDYWIRS